MKAETLNIFLFIAVVVALCVATPDIKKCDTVVVPSTLEKSIEKSNEEADKLLTRLKDIEGLLQKAD